LQQLNPEQVQEDICLVELQAEAQGPESELDQMWSYVAEGKPSGYGKKIDHHRSGKVFTYLAGERMKYYFNSKVVRTRHRQLLYRWVGSLRAPFREKSMGWASSICKRLKASISICEPGLNAYGERSAFQNRGCTIL